MRVYKPIISAKQLVWGSLTLMVVCFGLGWALKKDEIDSKPYNAMGQEP